MSAGFTVQQSARGGAPFSCFAREVFSFPAFLAVVLVAGGFVASSWQNVILGKTLTEGDVWWHLATGQNILATHAFPVLDPYSYTAAGTAWIAYGWLPELLIAISVRLHGTQGLALLLLLSVSTFYLLLYYYGWLCCRNAKAAAIACVAVMPITGAFVSPRPQFFAAILFVLVLICIEHFRQGKQNALWFLPGLFLLWVNTHGSFVLGIAFLVLCAIESALQIGANRFLTSCCGPGKTRQLAVVLLLCLVAVCLTPYGTRLAAYPFEFGVFQVQVKGAVTEWQPPDLHQAYIWVFVAIALGILLEQVIRPVRFRLSELVFLLFCAFYGCWHARFLLLFGLAVVPIIGASLTKLVPPYDLMKDKTVLNATLIVLILVLITKLFPSQPMLDSALARRYPVQAVRYLEAHPPVHLWNEDTWGSYLIWAARGRIKVFIDGRFDIYEYAGVLSDYLAAIRSSEFFERVLGKYNVDTVLLHRDAQLATYLAHASNWQRVYQDDVAVIFCQSDRRTKSGR
jgi:hypothetical protein